MQSADESAVASAAVSADVNNNNNIGRAGSAYSLGLTEVSLLKMSKEEDEEKKRCTEAFLATVTQHLSTVHIESVEQERNTDELRMKLDELERWMESERMDDHFVALVNALEPTSRWREWLDKVCEEEQCAFLYTLIKLSMDKSGNIHQYDDHLASLLAMDLSKSLVKKERSESTSTPNSNNSSSATDSAMDAILLRLFESKEDLRDSNGLCKAGLDYLQLRLKHLENLFQTEHCLHKAFLYARQIMLWMSNSIQKDIRGYYVLKHNEMYVRAVQVGSDSLLGLNRFSDALMLCNVAIDELNRRRMDGKEVHFFDRALYNLRFGVMEKMVDGLQNVNNCNNEDHVEKNNYNQGTHESEGMKEARIIVDNQAVKGFREGKFWVNDLDSALRIAKDNDTIFIARGVFKPTMSRHRDRFVFSLHKSLTLQGSGPSETTLEGSIVKYRSDAIVTLKDMRVELRERDEHDIYILQGSVLFVECVISASVNTAFFLIDEHGDELGCHLKMKNCLLDGNQATRRFISFQGKQPRLTLESCLMMDMYSLVTVISPLEASMASLKLINCVLSDMQDGLKIVVHHQSQLRLQLHQCHFDLVLLDKESPAHGVSMTGGTCEAVGNVIGGGNMDAIGYSLHSLRRAILSCNCVETDAETNRSTCLGKGYVISETLDVTLDLNEALGLRVGFELSNNQVGSCEIDQIMIRRCLFKESSLAIELKNGNPDLSIPLLGEFVQVESCKFIACHYAVLLNDPVARGSLRSCEFSQVPTPIVVHKDHARNLDFDNNKFVELSEESGSSSTDNDGSDDGNQDDHNNENDLSPVSGSPSRRFKMELHLAKTNVPYKVAVEKKRNFHFIETEQQLETLLKRHQNQEL